MSQRLKIIQSDNVTIAEFTDAEISKFDESAVDEISRQLFDIVQAHTPIDFLLSFSNVSYLNSSMLGILIRLKKRIKESQGRLKLCSLKPKIYEMFLFTEVYKLFEICDDQKTALNQFRTENNNSNP
ncbi:MAG: STAS domain-containing protein [Planctomycetes bacterium]|nr:STAS domain-containing protein [Planctomycetota bacterium]